MAIRTSIIVCVFLICCSIQNSKGAQCSYTLSPTSASLGAAATSGSFSVSVGNTCSWNATTTNSWLHTSSSGMGNGTVNYTLAANSNPKMQTGRIVVCNQP